MGVILGFNRIMLEFVDGQCHDDVVERLKRVERSRRIL